MLQGQEQQNSQQRNSMRQAAEVVWLVAWKKADKQNSSVAVQRRDVCLSCGESFEIPAESGELCTVKLE